jgi:16S rRNA (adenine1518-N6/adenine1519-N6)-dimethyltransferase
VLRSRRPKLGQHFLADSRYRRRIFESLDLHEQDLVIEIGAGRGAMTELLAERARRVIAIEIDPVLAGKLKEKVQNQPRIEVLQADILSCDIAEICQRNRSEQCFVFGNLPYYITSPILHRLFTFWTRVRAMALLVQREVALRLTASPGGRAYGYLSVLTQLYSQPRVVLNVPPGAFSPPPKVQSALVEFQIRPRFPEWFEEGEAPGAGKEKKFLEFVQRCFAQKRKNLLNNLGGIYPRGRTERELARLSLPRGVRAEQLTLDQFAELYRGLEALG